MWNLSGLVVDVIKDSLRTVCNKKPVNKQKSSRRKSSLMNSDNAGTRVTLLIWGNKDEMRIKKKQCENGLAGNSEHLSTFGFSVVLDIEMEKRNQSRTCQNCSDGV